MAESFPPIPAAESIAPEQEVRNAEAAILEIAKRLPIYDGEKGPFQAGDRYPELSVRSIGDGIFQVSIRPDVVWCFLDRDGKSLLSLGILRGDPRFAMSMGTEGLEERPGPDGEKTLYISGPKGPREQEMHIPKGTLAYYHAWREVEYSNCRKMVFGYVNAHGRKLPQGDLDFILSKNALRTSELATLKSVGAISQAMYDSAFPKIDLLAMVSRPGAIFTDEEIRGELEAGRITQGTAKALYRMMKLKGEIKDFYDVMKEEISKVTARRIQEEVKAQIDAQQKK